MDKKNWIIVGVIIAAFAGLIGISIIQNRSVIDYSQYDLNNIIPADENSGGLSENISGSADAPIVIYEYGDYQCTACAPINPYINEIIEEYDGKVAVVLRTYIMDYHDNGTAAASAANAAAIQGYWEEYKNLLYSKQNNWYYSNANERQQQFEEYFIEASNSKGDLEKFRSDMKSKAVSQKISFDRQLSQLVGVDWTPTFYLDGELIDQRGMNTNEFLKTLRQKIDEMLDERGIENPTKNKKSNNKDN